MNASSLSTSSTPTRTANYATQSNHILTTSFLQILVPCDNNYLRCQVTQRETRRVERQDFLPFPIETALSDLILK